MSNKNYKRNKTNNRDKTNNKNKVNKSHNKQNNANHQNGRSAKKKNMELLIDGENISHRKVDEILKAADSQGVLSEARVYGRQKDKRTKGWSDESKRHGLKDVRLYGGPEKNKVDKKIKKDSIKIINDNRSIDVVVIATSDAGYVDAVEEARSMGKKVVCIGYKNAPQKLRDACSVFIELK